MRDSSRHYDRPIIKPDEESRFAFYVAGIPLADRRQSPGPRALESEAAKLRAASRLDSRLAVEALQRLGFAEREIERVSPRELSEMGSLLSAGTKAVFLQRCADLPPSPEERFLGAYDAKVQVRALIAAIYYLRSQGVTRPKDILSWLNGSYSASRPKSGLTRDSLRSVYATHRRFLKGCPSYTLLRTGEDVNLIRLLEKVRSIRAPRSPLSGKALAIALDDKFDLEMEVLLAREQGG